MKIVIEKLYTKDIEEVWVEMEVGQGLARVAPEVREKIRSGEPF